MSNEFALPAELTIYGVAELRRQLLAHVDAHADDEICHIDASAVDQVDGAGLQLLVSLVRTLSKLGRTLQIEPASPALSAACESLGLTGHLINPSQERAAA